MQDETMKIPAVSDNLHELVLRVLTEVEKATNKFPTWPTDPLHALAVLGEEFGELNKEVLQMCYEPWKTSHADIETEAIQTAAMSLRFLLSLKTYRYRPREQHSQNSVIDGKLSMLSDTKE